MIEYGEGAPSPGTVCVLIVFRMYGDDRFSLIVRFDYEYSYTKTAVNVPNLRVVYLTTSQTIVSPETLSYRHVIAPSPKSLSS